MITLYHSRLSRSVRVRWLLEELGVPYQIAALEFSPASLRSAEHLARHPLGQVPVIEDDGLVLFESGAILQHIMERHGDGGLLPPAGTAERSLCWQWFHFGETAVGRYFGDIVRSHHRKTEAERVPSVIAEARERFAGSVRVIESALGDRPYLLGDRFSVADIMVSYAPIVARALKELGEVQHPRAVAYARSLRARPACQRALAD
jgi:glutathione S-transferase